MATAGGWTTVWMTTDPKGKAIRTTTDTDANLIHDMVTGSLCYHFFDQTQVDWFAKRHDQVESATYRSEFSGKRRRRSLIESLGILFDRNTMRKTTREFTFRL